MTQSNAHVCTKEFYAH